MVRRRLNARSGTRHGSTICRWRTPDLTGCATRTSAAIDADVVLLGAAFNATAESPQTTAISGRSCSPKVIFHLSMHPTEVSIRIEEIGFLDHRVRRKAVRIQTGAQQRFLGKE